MSWLIDHESDLVAMRTADLESLAIEYSVLVHPHEPVTIGALCNHYRYIHPKEKLRTARKPEVR